MFKPILLAALLLPSPAKRRETANEIYEYLRKHCLRLEEDPLQYGPQICYDLHREANELYDLRVDARKIRCVLSDFTTGAYTPFDYPFCPVCPAYLGHEILMGKIIVAVPRCRP